MSEDQGSRIKAECRTDVEHVLCVVEMREFEVSVENLLISGASCVGEVGFDEFVGD